MNRTPGFIVEANISVPAADGTRLATDVYRPSGDGAGPVVLLRTPYGKGGHVDEGLGWARHGIAFVVQDVRGRYDSEGVWEPYTLEREDGTATIAWLAGQPWCDGRIVLTGGSYAAFAAFVGALSGHPAIRGVISLVPAMGTHATAFTDSGVLNLGDHLWWWATFAEGRSERRRLVEVMLQRDGCCPPPPATHRGAGLPLGTVGTLDQAVALAGVPRARLCRHGCGVAGPGRAGPPRRRVA